MKRVLFSAALLPLFLFAFLAMRTQAQDGKGSSELRTVHGSVLDKSDAPAPASVVYLLNTKTQAVKTYIADDAGNYRFSGLDPNVDYQIHAEHGDSASATRTISNYDTRHDMEITLKLSRKKGA